MQRVQLFGRAVVGIWNAPVSVSLPPSTYPQSLKYEPGLASSDTVLVTGLSQRHHILDYPVTHAVGVTVVAQEADGMDSTHSASAWSMSFPVASLYPSHAPSLV